MTAPLSYSLITGKEIMFEKSLFLTCEILGLLVNTLATNENYHVLNRVNLTIPIQMQLPQKQKYFSEFSVKYLKSRLNFEHFKKNMTLTAFVFPKLRTLKTWLDKCLKISRFRGPFEKQHGKRAKALLKFASQHLYYIHQSLLSQLSWKKCLLLTCKILELLVNTLCADEKNLVLHKDNLTIPIQMQLSEEQKCFS